LRIAPPGAWPVSHPLADLGCCHEAGHSGVARRTQSAIRDPSARLFAPPRQIPDNPRPFRPGTWPVDTVGRAGGRTNEDPMKPGIHPEYREVVFQDMQNDFKFITRSTVQTKETIEFNGKTYPLFKLDTSSESHPFYTGAQTRIVETGRVEKFRQKFAAKTEQVNAAAAQATAAKSRRK
jgi:large subunit ribosomal protein L31